MSYQILHNLAEQCWILLQQVTMVWESGSLPEDWRTAIVCPIHKPGRPPTEMAGYRPVALTSAAGKLMEHMALQRLSKREAGLFDERQTCFRGMCCTADYISDVVSASENARAARQTALLLLLDLSSAFESMCCAAILVRVKGAGVDGRASIALCSGQPE